MDETAGCIVSMTVKGKTVIERGAAFSLWRAPTDNDGVKGMAWDWESTWKPLGRWNKAGYNRLTETLESFDVAEKDGGIVIASAHRYVGTDAPKGFTHKATYTLRNGKLHCSHSFIMDEGLTDVPRLGVRWDLAPGFEQLEWFGKGPLETYPDRQTAAVGRYRSTVTDQYVPYVLPQEHGHHEATRWLELSNGETTLRIAACQRHFGFNALHTTAEDLTALTHSHEVTPRPETILYLDAVHRGLGTASCGPDTLPCYTIQSGTYTLDYAIAIP